MQLTLSWLKKFIPEFEIHDLENFKHKLDTRLSEVENVARKGEGLQGLVVGEILETNPHPTNPNLTVCVVTTGGESRHTIVCGAPNAKVGVKSVLCLPGGKVYNTQVPGEMLTITNRKIGEVESEGMLCAPDEIGLSNDHSKIIELNPSSTPGEEITTLFDDIVIEIENKALPHRPDAFSHLGIAREISAIFKSRLVLEPTSLSTRRSETDIDLRIQNKVGDLCPRYSGISISGVQVAPSPLWLQIALSYCGVRPVNNIVDITNFVMLDLGQPLHAFDTDKVTGREIIVRKSRGGEKLTTIDHNERELPEGSLLITDREKILGVAGVMGGLESEVSEETSNIFLEAANFEMYSIRKTARQLGLRSEAVTRFEKGIDPEMTLEALQRCANMIIDICGGEIASEIIDHYPEPKDPVVIRFNLSNVKRYLGVDIEKTKIISILRSLGFNVPSGEKASVDVDIDVVVPSWRRDVKASEDLIEEIGRLYGYEHIAPTLPKRDLQGPLPNKTLVRLQEIKNVLSSSGLFEVYTYTMVGAELYSDALINPDNLLRIANPISPELGLIRDQIVPSLLAKVAINASKRDNFGIYEIGRVGIDQKGEQGLPYQPYRLGAIRVSSSDEAAARELKYALEELSRKVFNGLLTVEGQKPNASYLHPAKSGTIEFNGEKVGEFGIVHPLALENLGLENYYVAAMQIDINRLFEAEGVEPKFNAISNFQPVIRDISFWQAERSFLQSTINDIKSQDISLLKELRTTDIFTKDGKRSITLRFVLQSNDHTLEQSEINEVMERLQQVISKNGHELR